jgi:RNA polymerase sigma-70 factor (ECF subfamily)
MLSRDVRGTSGMTRLGNAITGPASEDVTRLVGQISDGDQSAFERTYENFRGYVFALAQRHVRCEFEAEEVLQDVFLALWNRPPMAQFGLPSLIAWLRVTTRNHCWLRLRRLQPTMVALGSCEELHYSEALNEAIGLAEMRTRLETEFPKAPPKHQEVLELTYYQDMGATEIARHLGVPVITVRKRLEAATARLNRHFSLETAWPHRSSQE